MTEVETVQQEDTTQTDATASLYERLRDSAPKAARVEWRDGDRWVSHLREKLSSLEANESLSDKGRYDAAGHLLETTAAKISRSYEKAAEVLRKEARRQELTSVPLPDNKDLTFKVANSSDLTAIQNEARAIIGKVERRQAKIPKSVKNRGDVTVDVLKNEYAATFSAEGVEAMAKARGVLKACEELGIDRHEVISPFMQEKHREAADESRRLEYLAMQVPSPKAMIPANPFSPEGKPKGEYHTNRGGNLFAPRPTTMHTPASGARGDGRRRPWK